MGIEYQNQLSFEDRLGHDQRYAIDPTKTRLNLVGIPSLFDDGIQEIEWYLSHQDWCDHIERYQKYGNQMIIAKIGTGNEIIHC
ncbi:MAG: hypothetical protein ACLRQX_01760 [Turicibacter sanguinis]